MDKDKGGGSTIAAGSHSLTAKWGRRTLPKLVLTSKRLPLREGFAPAVQRVSNLTVVPDLLRQFGVRPASVLRKAGIDRAALADPNGRIPYANLVVLLTESVQATGCEHFGVLVGSRLHLADLGMPAALALKAPTLGRAIERFATMQWMNATGGVAFVSRSDAMTGFGYAIFNPGVDESLATVYDLAISVGVAMIRQLCGKPDWRPQEVSLSRARPADVAPYRHYFLSALRFDAEASIIWFPSKFEDSPVIGNNDAWSHPPEEGLHPSGDDTLLPRVYRMVRVALLLGLTSGNEVAAAMGLSRRTFNRRLADCGITFRDALEAVRFEAARQLLRDTKLSVGEIAAALGYAESSALVRAFRRWSGEAPNAWRERTKTVRGD